MIDYRGKPWLPFAIIIGWLAWLTLAGLVGLAGLRLTEGAFLISVVWMIAVAFATFGLPIWLLRRINRDEEN